MKGLKQYLGQELFELYFRLSSEVLSLTGDTRASLAYLNLCLRQCEALAVWQSAESRLERDYMTDAQMVRVKINDIEKSMKKEASRARFKRAAEFERKGDKLVKAGQLLKAVRCYEYMMTLACDNDDLLDCINETHATAAFKLARVKLHLATTEEAVREC